jgi:hypothetical protein
LTRGMKQGKIYDFENQKTDSKTGRSIVPFTEAYDGDQVKKIADDAGEMVRYAKANDPARKYYSKLLNDPESETWQRFNEAYQSVYGKDKIVQTPEQAAQADAILRARGEFKKGEEAMLNKQFDFNLWKQKQAISDSYIRGRAKDASTVNDLWTRIDNEVTRLTDYGERNIPPAVLDVDAQNVLSDFVNKGKSELDRMSLDDINLRKSESGEIIITDNKGKVLGSLPKVGTNLKVQPGVKEKRVVVSEGEPKRKSTYTINGKKYTDKQLTDMGYDINDARVKKYKDK